MVLVEIKINHFSILFKSILLMRVTLLCFLFSGIPICGPEPEVAQLYSRKSGARRIFEKCKVSVPPGEYDIYSFHQVRITVFTRCVLQFSPGAYYSFHQVRITVFTKCVLQFNQVRVTENNCTYKFSAYPPQFYNLRH